MVSTVTQGMQPPQHTPHQMHALAMAACKLLKKLHVLRIKDRMLEVLLPAEPLGGQEMKLTSHRTPSADEVRTGSSAVGFIKQTQSGLWGAVFLSFCAQPSVRGAPLWHVTAQAASVYHGVYSLFPQQKAGASNNPVVIHATYYRQCSWRSGGLT